MKKLVLEGRASSLHQIVMAGRYSLSEMPLGRLNQRVAKSSSMSTSAPSLTTFESAERR